jgi:hypothetical protein
VVLLILVREISGHFSRFQFCLEAQNANTFGVAPSDQFEQLQAVNNIAAGLKRGRNGHEHTPENKTGASGSRQSEVKCKQPQPRQLFQSNAFFFSA